MMTEAHIGRLLAACLHQAIVDRLPQRLDFYEHWLNAEGLREGTIGLAPLTAVIGFLRTEGPDYEPVVSYAGELAASWSVAGLTPARRRVISWLPRALRARGALRLASGIVRAVSSASHTSIKLRSRRAKFEVRLSLFCEVREKTAAPLCGFYRSLAIEALRQFEVRASGTTESCRAMGAHSCVMLIDLS